MKLSILMAVSCIINYHELQKSLKENNKNKIIIHGALFVTLLITLIAEAIIE
jgi:hypothetical protein